MIIFFSLAPQVGAGAAIFVAFIPNNIAPDVKPMPETVFYNPTLSIVETGGYVEMWESCLTIPDKMYCIIVFYYQMDILYINLLYLIEEKLKEEEKLLLIILMKKENQDL